MSGPLSGLRIIDLSTIGMGPYATQTLGDMGADVIKVEPPGGDIFRHAGQQRNPGMGAPFLNLNRNKRSIVLDLKDPQDRAQLLALIDEADVFVFNVRPQSLRRLGLDYERLAARNPRLIYCGTYGFSEAGPYAGRPAYDDIIQGLSGLAALQGRSAGGPPRYVGTILADKVAGLAASNAIAMALYERERSGRGQAIEVPMFETLVAFNLVEHLGGETFRPAEGSTGYDRVLSPHRQPYATRDGYLCVLPYTDRHWRSFFELAGRSEVLDDPRFASAAVRARHVDELYAVLAAVMRERSSAEWRALLAEADIPHGAVLAPEDLPADEHLAATGFFREMEHPSEGTLRVMDVPVRFSRTPASIRRHAPGLDEHRDEILQEGAPPERRRKTEAG